MLLNTTNTIVDSGKSCYWYYKMSDHKNELILRQAALDTFSIRTSNSKKVSENYSCHCWIKETASVLVCTEEGDILLTDYEGKFLAYITNNLLKEPELIECIYPTSFGFVIAGNEGKLWLFKTEKNSKHYYKGFKEIKDQGLWETQNITNLSVSSKEDYAYFITKNN